jgi:hypothetical protein
MCCGTARAQEPEGTWKLVARKLPDGTTQVPPALEGVATFHRGLRNLVVFWHTPAGKPASFSLISNYQLSPTQWTETLLVSVFIDGSGKPPVYNLTAGTKTAPVTGDGRRIVFHPPFDAPSFAFEGDKFMATNKGVFIDYWERVR